MATQKLSSNIFISRLSFYTTTERIKSLFSHFGVVNEVRLVKDFKTQRPKGFAFVEFQSEDEAHKALKAMNGRIVDGRMIFVEFAKERRIGEKIQTTDK